MGLLCYSYQLHSALSEIVSLVHSIRSKTKTNCDSLVPVFPRFSLCTGSQEPIQKTQQCSTAKQRFVKKRVQWLFPLCTGTPGHHIFFEQVAP